MGELNDAPAERYDDLKVLLVEDDEIMRLSLEDRMRIEGIPVCSAACLGEAHERLGKGDIDLVVTDIRLPDGTGKELFAHVSSRHPGVPVVLMTAFGSVSEAVALVKGGATDYLTKPFDPGEFIARVKRWLGQLADTQLATELEGPDGSRVHAGSGFLGKSAAMRRVERLVARLAEVDSSVLISGESGVGKEVVARLIHRNGRRADGPFVCVNCAAIPVSLFESELFGHERGAFTGADRRHLGRFEQANGGTIFLDEIADIPPEIQVKLLRVLQERTVERLGGATSIPLDVRIIAATQVDLAEAVEAGRFRADLYWRLNVIHIPIRPLRERKEDIVYLSRLFVSRQGVEMNKPARRISPEAEVRLAQMEYPGNVRELKNILERAVALGNGTRIEPHDLSPLDLDEQAEEPGECTPSLKEAVEETERLAIVAALDRNDWAIRKTAESLSISRKNLWEKMKRYGIHA
jgi:DNA-binding NtrC family response regulator